MASDDDISNLLEKAYKEIEENKLMFQLLFDEIPTSIAILDEDGNVVDINKKFYETFKYIKLEAIGRNISDLILPDDKFKESKEIKKNVRDGNYSLNYDTIRHTKFGEEVYVEISGNAILLKGERRYIAVYNDIGARKNYEKKLIELANIDYLTKAYNRQFLDSEINKELERAKRYKRDLSFIMSDIDFFKNINDFFGHVYADTVLIDVAKIMKQDLRTTDYLVRYGGEEFLIVLPETSLNEATSVAERIRVDIEKYSFEKGEITCSFGVYSYNFKNGDLNLDSIIDKADKKLYLAKNSGRNCVIGK